VRVMQDPCPGLVAQIESGDLSGSRTRAILERAVLPMLAAGVDTIVMGCTHYPFVIPLIRQIAGPGVQVIDPAPAIARQVGRLLSAGDWLACDAGQGAYRFFTSGNPVEFTRLLPVLLGEPGPVQPFAWLDGRLQAGNGQNQSI